MQHGDSFVAALRGLVEDGRVVLRTPLVPAPAELRAAESVLIEFEQRYRLEMPGVAAGFSMPAALWGAEMMYAACQCLAFREIDEEELTRRLSRPFPGRRDASAHYSVDLTFRLLPDLHHRARSASRNDPLVARLQEWVEDWPLSSVGMPEATRENAPANAKPLDAILEHPSLRTLYVDRIMARDDRSRLSDPRVRELVLEAIGLHEELAPDLFAAANAFNMETEKS
jgi:MoxR-vWA-beta-propeller ternary system domain bpX4